MRMEPLLKKTFTNMGIAEKSAEETARLYQIPGGVRLKQLLFAIHTFYAFLMKLISIELVSLQDRSTVKSFVTQITYE